jgi:3'(2'),5'-bisphosphate nucleotidase
VILEALARAAPDVPVVAEEAVAAGRMPRTDGAFYLVDPLDGTKEFISRNGEFTVNIGLIDEGMPVAGVVYLPARGEIFAGDANGAWTARVEDGALRDRRPICAALPEPSGVVVVASRSHLTDETRAFIERFPVAEFAAAGSSLKFCRVASGDADLYPRLARTMEWDTAAGDAVLRAAGGTVRTMDGALLTYGKRNQPGEADFANPWFVASGRFNPFAG